MVVFEGKDMVLGRLATFVAKELLKGNHVDIVNAEKILISGRREATFEHYEAWLGTRNVANPRKGPFHPKLPEDIARRAVRGMLPFKKPMGKKAYGLLRAYRGVPEKLAGKETVTIQEAGVKQLGTKRYISLEELSKHMGVNL
jgi:large subunit ribosomal protein L13